MPCWRRCFGWRCAARPLLARRAAPIAFVVAVLYAVSDEFHQSFVPGRYPDIRDILVDAAGVLAALLLLRWWARRRTPLVNE